MDMFTRNNAQRLGGEDFGRAGKTYKFARIKQAKAEAIKKHQDMQLIDMGVGEPDMPADPGIVQLLAEEAGKPENRWYADNGIPEFQEAAKDYLEKVYHLGGLDPYRNIVHGIGSKPILAMIPLIFTDPGDITLTTVPGYPVLGTYTEYLGGRIYKLHLFKENDFYPDFSIIPKSILKKTKLLYLNYPNNPTGQAATKDFYEEAIAFASRNGIVVISDAAYAAITFDDSSPLSFLSVKGAGEVGVEIHSLSKAFNMTGWRLAFIVGSPKVVNAYGAVKDNTDSGQFRAIQKAGIYALNHPEITKENCKRYSRRFDLLIEALKEVGFDAQKPKGTFYCYVPAPKGTESGTIFKTAEEASTFLIEEALISTVPWDDAGAYLRFSVTFEAKSYQEEIELIEELKQRLSKLGLTF